MTKRSLAFLIFVGATSFLNFAFAQTFVEAIDLKNGENTSVYISHPVGIKQYLKVDYLVHCVQTIDSAKQKVKEFGGIAIGPNDTILVENRDRRRSNPYAHMIEVSCSPGSNITNISARDLHFASDRHQVPLVVWPGDKVIPQILFKTSEETLPVSFALHCSNSFEKGTAIIMHNGGIVMGENSLVVVEDKFHAQSNSKDDVSIVSCETKPSHIKDVIEVDPEVKKSRLYNLGVRIFSPRE